MAALRERLSFEDVTELFDRPGSCDDLCRRFVDLMAERLPIARCAVALGSRADHAFAAASGEGELPLDVVAPGIAALDALYRGEGVAHDETLFLPLVTTNGACGFVCWIGSERAFDDEDVRRLRSYARVFALVIDVAQLSAEVERLADRSTSDALTGILNRRGFDERMRLEWRRAIREKSPLAVALLDIDYFKGYNDLWGRHRGDDCLKHVARAIAQAGLRAGDFVARYGGEEFAIVMPGADEGGALVVCDRIRAFVALRAIDHPASPHRIVTISGGVASTVPEPGGSISHLLYQADTNLYRAKSAGRNRVAGDRAIRSSPLRAARLALPVAAAPLAGRAKELAELERIDAPIVTIVGAAGIGKSALALEFAHRAAKHAIYVDLSACDAGEDVGAHVAQALTADPSGDAALLLVLDGCDRVRAAAASFAAEAVSTPGLRILATCREPLGAPDERLFAPGPLSLDDATALYEQAANAAGVSLEDDPAQARRRAEELHGNPLAIELDVFARRFHTLSTAEQRVLGRLAIFAQGCSIDAARAVCGDGSPEVIQALADQSLLGIDGEPKVVRVRPTLREFLLEHLRDSGDRQAALVGFARYFASSDPVLRQNAEAVLAWAMEEGDVAAGAELLARQGMGFVRGIHDEARQHTMLEFGMHAGENGALAMPLRMRVTAMAAHMAFILGQFATFDRLSAWLVEHAEEARDPYVSYILTKRAIEKAEPLERADALARAGLALASASEDLQLQSAIRVLQANVAWRRGDNDEAARLFGRIVRSLRAGDFHYGFESVMLRSTKFELARNNVDEALARLLDVLRSLRRRSKPGAVAGTLDAYVEAACRRDKHDVAERLHAFTQRYHRMQNRHRSPSAQAAYEAVAARYDLPMPPPDGDLTSVEDAFALALTI